MRTPARPAGASGRPSAAAQIVTRASNRRWSKVRSSSAPGWAAEAWAAARAAGGAARRPGGAAALVQGPLVIGPGVGGVGVATISDGRRAGQGERGLTVSQG